MDVRRLLEAEIHVHRYESADGDLIDEFDIVPSEVYGVDRETGEVEEDAYIQYAYDLPNGQILEIRIPVANLKTE